MRDRETAGLIYVVRQKVLWASKGRVAAGDTTGVLVLGFAAPTSNDRLGIVKSDATPLR